MKTIIRDQNQRNLEPSGNDGDFNVVDIVGPSLSIVEVVREDSRDLSELPRLPLCYRYVACASLCIRVFSQTLVRTAEDASGTAHSVEVI